MATSWLHERGILVAQGIFVQGRSIAPQGSTGCWQWGGWFGGHPGAALALLAVAVGQAVSRLLSALLAWCLLPQPEEGDS